jgi:hypothetical protein
VSFPNTNPTLNNYLSILDTINVEIIRITYNGVQGVFLPNEQELITLAKFQWKEIYKLQAQQFQAERDKLKLDLIDSNQERDLYKTEVVNSHENILLLNKSYQEIKIENDSNIQLVERFKSQSTTYKIISAILGGGLIYVIAK